jgi:polysaccharide deacetylase 2 family uncharacterized protein YibQ
VSRRATAGLGARWLLALLWACVLGTVLYADILLLQLGPVRTPQPIAQAPAWSGDFNASVDHVTAALTALPIPLPTPRTEPQGAGGMQWTHRSYAVAMRRPRDSDEFEAWLAPLRAAAPGVTLVTSEVPNGTVVQVGIDGLLTHTLRFHWFSRNPRVALIIDDMGNDFLVAHDLVRLDGSVTVAVLPFQPFSREVAELAHAFHRDVLLHLPMEATTARDDEVVALRVGTPHAVFEQQLVTLLDAVPYAVGVSNHMGSALTTDRDRMQWVLEALKQRNLFFIDSRTTADSVACEVARTVGVKCAVRALFLDDTDTPEAIRAQVDTLLDLARTRPTLIAIGHPRPATIAALREALPRLAAAQIDVVPVSAILADTSLSGR